MIDATFKDRKVGLVIFGIIQLLVALGFLAMAGMQLLVVSGAMGPEFTGPPGLYAVAARGDGLVEIYEAMGPPPEQLEIMRSIGILTTVPWMMLASVVVMLGFHLWLGRYFAAAESHAAA